MPPVTAGMNAEIFPKVAEGVRRKLMNRKVLTAILPLVLVAAGMAQDPAAKPATAPAPSGPLPTKIGIVDIQAAILATNEGHRAFQELQTKYGPKQSELQKLSQEVDDLKKQLQTQGSKLNDDARNNMVRDIETKQKSLQRQAEDAQTEFQQERDEIAGKILQKLGPVLADYAKKRNYAVILDSSQPWPQGEVVWVAEPIDLTQEIVEAYNKASGVAAPSSEPNAPSAAKPSAPLPRLTLRRGSPMRMIQGRPGLGGLCFRDLCWPPALLLFPPGADPNRSLSSALTVWVQVNLSGRTGRRQGVRS